MISLFDPAVRDLHTSQSHLNQRGRAIAVVAVVLTLLAAACASTPKGKAYQSISACNVAEQTAMRAFGVLYQANKATDPATWGARYDKAQAAHLSYEKIRDSAVDVAQAGGDPQVTLAAVNEALNQLTILLATFGVK
jgi:hypothetical protein